MVCVTLPLMLIVVAASAWPSIGTLRELAAMLDARTGGYRTGRGPAGPARCPECGRTPAHAAWERDRRGRFSPAMAATLLAGPLATAIFGGPWPRAWRIDPLPEVLARFLLLSLWMSLPFLIVAGWVWTSGLMRHRRAAAWVLAACTLPVAVAMAWAYHDLPSSPILDIEKLLVAGSILTVAAGWLPGIVALPPLVTLIQRRDSGREL